MKTFKEMVSLFETSNRNFIQNDIDLFKNGVSERTLCGGYVIIRSATP